MIGEEIKNARIKAGLTQAQLAAKMGIERQHVWAIEQGRKGVSDERKQLFAEVLGCFLIIRLEKKS